MNISPSMLGHLIAGLIMLFQKTLTFDDNPMVS